MIDTPTIEWWAFMPELVTGIGAIVVLLACMSSGAVSRMLAPLLTLGILVAGIVVAFVTDRDVYVDAYAGQIDSDAIASLARLLAMGAAIIAVAFSWRGRKVDHRHGEHHALILAATAGLCMFASAGSLVTMFVGLELFSIALYVLCALEAERVTALESGLKYLIVGGLSSAVLLYGMTLTYGATGTFILSEIGDASQRGLLLAAGAAMLIAGLAFKASAAPLHFWTPDVYEGAPTPVTAFMAAATKAAAFIALTRVLVLCFHQDAAIWEPLIAFLAAASIIVGNLAALAQERVKRMLAYSSIAHAGYMLVALLAWDGLGISALAYGLVVYVVMTLGAFALVTLWERQLARPVTFTDLRGRGWKPEYGAPWLGLLPAVAMLIIMGSLAGLPPTAGFFAKFAIFGAAVDAGYAWLALLGVLGSVVSLAYYLRGPIAMFLLSSDETTGDEEPTETIADRSLLAGCGIVGAVAVIALGIFPGALYERSCDTRNDLFAQIDRLTSGCNTSANVTFGSFDDQG